MAQTDFEFGYNVADDPPTYDQACMGILVCPHCGKAVMCGDIQPAHVVTTEDTNDMIPRGSGGSNQPNSNGQRGGQRRKGTGLRYLTVDLLTTAHQLAVVTDAKVMPDNFRPGQDSLVLKLKFRGEFVLWTVRSGNPNLDVLGDAMGDDERAYKDRELELFLEVDDFTGKSQIRCEVVPVNAKRK